MSFRVRVDIDSELCTHHGYVSAPSLAEMGPLGTNQGMDIGERIVGEVAGQYFFDLRWANQVAPRDGMAIRLTVTFSFACSPEMSSTLSATTTVQLLLCRNETGLLVWKAPGETCETCAAWPPPGP
jgi:hypothetical protein